MKSRRIVCALLIICQGIICLAACGSGGTGAEVTTLAADTAETTEAVVTELKPGLPEADYNGYEFNIVVRKASGTDPWGNFEMAVEEINGEVLNDSIAERNRLVEEAYNISIV